MTVNQQTVACPVCQGRFDSTSDKSISYPRYLEQSRVGVPEIIRFCQNCGLGVAHPMPTAEELDKIYSQGEFWKASRPEIFSARKYPLFYALALLRWNLIESFLLKQGVREPVSILDIGSGHGFLGIVAAGSRKIRIAEYAAVEKDNTFNESLKKTWQKYFHDKTLTIADSVEDTQRSYDVVVLSHVLEHLTDPNQLLAGVRKKLTAKGVLFIDIPFRDYLFKENVFPHVLFFDKDSLKKLCEKNGFRINMIESYGQNRDRSPLGARRKKGMRDTAVRALFACRGILPAGLLISFLSGYYGIDKKNPEGTWLRALAYL